MRRTAWLTRCVPISLTYISTGYYIYRLDGLFQFQPSFVVGRLVHSLPAGFQIALSVAYSLMPIAIIAIYWASAWRYPQESRTVARALILNLALSAPCYFLVPVAGPSYAFPGFPAAAVTAPSRIATPARSPPK